MPPRTPDPFAFLTRDTLLHMGLNPVTDRDWVAPFSAAELARFHQHKLRLLAAGEHAPDSAQPVLVAAQAVAAVGECRQALQQHLQRDHGAAVAACGIAFKQAPASDATVDLQDMSLWLPDDICILQANTGGDYVLTAAAVFCPSLWLPADKMNKTLADIHHPIPEFGQRLLPSVNRFFHHLKVGRPVVRFNWAIQVGDALARLPGQVARKEGPLFFRSERQSLLRLPDSGAVVFLIRTQLWSLAELDEISGEVNLLQRLLRHIDRLSQPERDYKGISNSLLTTLEQFRTGYTG